MSEYRIRSTGEVKTQGEIRKIHSNMSLPRVWDSSVCDALGIDPVLEGPQASGLEWWQYSMRSGVEQVNGTWYTKYIAGPVFTDLNEEMEYITQKEQERNSALYKSIQDSTQKRLDDFAQTRSYAGMLSLCTYATSTNAKFQAEGQYGVEARDATWAKLYEILAEVEAGTRPVPSGYDDIEPELPALQWPV